MYISIYLPLLPLSLSLSPYRISLCPKVGEFFTKEDSPVGVRVESIGLGVDPMDDMSRFWVERYGNRFIHFIFMVYGLGCGLMGRFWMACLVSGSRGFWWFSPDRTLTELKVILKLG